MKSLKLLLRFAIIAALVLVLLIPLTMIRGTVHDRQGYRDQAVERVSQSKAGEQAFIAPVRYLPWTEMETVEVTDDKGHVHKEDRIDSGVIVQTPTRLDIVGKLKPSERRIGLFNVPVYTWQATIRAEFDDLDYPAAKGRSYGRPYLAVGLSDVRGLVGTPNLRVDGKAVALQPGSGAMQASNGVHADLAPLADPRGGRLGDVHQVEMELALDGTRSLAIVPVGDNNEIALSSSWPHPLFGGQFLPNERSIDDHGFRASWSLSALATKSPAMILGNARGLDALETVKVDLVDPVDVYTQADRATKYGVLFVLLTFVGFVLFELIKRLPIHPVQYLLVGLALAIFFLLLLSLSEHIAFWQAYLVSAAACIGLQFVYLTGVLRSWGRAGGFAAMLTALYGVLYSLLVSEDNALLMGSLMLFGILAAIMWITRKVDWYELGGQLR